MRAAKADEEFPTPRVGNSLPFVGRTHALALIRAEYDKAADGQPRVVVVSGPAGIGKTTLLRRFIGDARPSCLLQTSGDELEQELSLTAVGQLLPAKASQSRPDTPHAAGLALAERLTAQAVTEGAALVVVVDNAELVDRPSLEAMTMAMRRLERVPALWLLACRAPADVLPAGMIRLVDGDSGAYLPLDGLDTRELVELCRLSGGGPLPVVSGARLRRHTGGNPARIRELVDEVGWSVIRQPAEVLPATTTAQRTAELQLQRCGDAVAAFIRVAAVVGDVADVMTVAEVAGIGDTATVIDEAVAADVLVIPPQPATAFVAFADPMVRAAVYHDLGVAERSRLHHAVAAATSGSAALEHRLAAVVGADGDTADAVERHADEAEATAAPAVAARCLARAAHITPDEQTRVARRLRAAELHLVHGDVAEAAIVAQHLPPAGQHACLHGRINLALGDWDAAERLLQAAAADPSADDRTVAEALIVMVDLRLAEARAAEAVEIARRAAQRWSGATTQASLVRSLAAAGDMAGAQSELEAYSGAPAMELALARGTVALEVGDFAAAVGELEAASGAASRRPTAERLVAVQWLAYSHYVGGRWDELDDVVDGGLALAADTSSQSVLAPLEVLCALPAAARDEGAVVGAALERAAEGRVARDAATLRLILWVQVEAAAARADANAAIAAVEAMTDKSATWPSSPSPWAGWQAGYVEALVAAQRLDTAEAALTSFMSQAGDRAWLSATLRRAQGVLAAATSGNAEKPLRRAVSALAELPAPLDAARARLALGRVLRRNGRRDDALRELHQAAEVCALLAAHGWEEQVRHELALCGVGRRSSRRGGGLTPQERTVAGLAAQGLSSRDIAARLTVSVKTVEYHLGNVYAKLDIRSRTQLAARFAELE